MPADLPAEIKSVEVLRLQPGDYLICKLEKSVHEDGRWNIQHRLGLVFGLDVDPSRILVTMPGMEINIIRPDAADPLLYGDPMECVD